MTRPRADARSSASNSSITLVDRARDRLRLDEVISLVGKIQRRLEPGHEIEQARVECLDARGQCAFELIERDARLQRCHRVDQIRDGLRLHEIDPCHSGMPGSVNSPGRASRAPAAIALRSTA